ncbi:hypothetical protein QU42_17410 [Bradyrhizobium sp. UASWS1016]|jgi:hypothetical protein|nr:hypothetical protein [uncultured Bradyrhizobium sp.]KIU52461.1 hypothetical protein QU41_02825 [Bradyrhizobium elkanii]OCX29475.1 hypothetical protein QU42_17410 [Bradyrhizobium sp. UASWS1016]
MKTIQKRKRSEPHTFEQRLEEHRMRLESQLARLPQGAEREQTAARIEQLRTAVELNAMLSMSE